jgi:hypothetical protein
MPHRDAEVAGVELIGGTDIGTGRDRRMERDRDGRPESEWGHAAWAGDRDAGGVRSGTEVRSALSEKHVGETQSERVTYTDPSECTDNL